jgi:hypothetical protein
MSSLSGNQGPRIRAARDGDGAPYEAITLDRLTPVIGAEIGGVDLGNLSNRQFDEIHRALAEHGAVFFRDQRITPEQQLAFGRRFGELHLHPAAPHEPGHPELMVIKADENSKGPTARAGTRTCPATRSRPWAPSSTSRSARRPAATRSSPACTRPTTRCRTA